MLELVINMNKRARDLAHALQLALQLVADVVRLLDLHLTG